MTDESTTSPSPSSPNFDDPSVPLILEAPPQRTAEELRNALVDAESRMQTLKSQIKALKSQMKGIREDMKDIDAEIDGIMEQLA